MPFDAYDFFGYIASGVVLLCGMQLVFGFPLVLGRELKPFDTAVAVLGVYVLGQIAAGPAKAIFEDMIVARLLASPTINLLRERAPWLRRRVFPGYYVALPKPVCSRIHVKAKQLFGDVSGEALFLSIRFCEPVRNDDRLMKRLDSFRDKYGFSRNLSFSSLVVGVALLLKGGVVPDGNLLRYGIALLLIGLLLFYRYLKFFKQYSYELLNSFAGSR
jgi:hypothetical protein